MMRTIFVAVLLLLTTVNAQVDFPPEYDMDPDDCALKDLTDCTMEPNDQVCPVPCGWGYIGQTWNCGGGPVTCKESCRVPKLCTGQEVVNVIEDVKSEIMTNLPGVISKIKKWADLKKAIEEAIMRDLAAFACKRLEITFRAIIPCKPAKGVGWMYIVLRVQCYDVNGIRVADLICYVKLPCCCEKLPGGGGGGSGVPALCSCQDVQATMGPPQWCSCPLWTWPPPMWPAIFAFKNLFKP